MNTKSFIIFELQRNKNYHTGNQVEIKSLYQVISFLILYYIIRELQHITTQQIGDPDVITKPGYAHVQITDSIVTVYQLLTMNIDKDKIEPYPATETFEMNKVSVKIPPFWADKPDIWFYQVEAQFSILKIVSEETRFNYLVAQLEPRYVEHIWDIVKENTGDKYSLAKARLLKNFQDSEEKQIKQLLTGLELGDQKPSELCRKMKALSSNLVSEKVLRTLWLEKLPVHIKNILVVSDEDLEKITLMADKIVAMNSSSEICSNVKDEDTFNALRNKISDLEKQISALTCQNRRSRSRTPNANRNMHRSRSRARFDQNGKYCYYHFRFGKNCKPEKCREPCAWSKQGN